MNNWMRHVEMNVPQELLTRRIWLVVKVTPPPEEGGKWGKLPYYANGSLRGHGSGLDVPADREQLVTFAQLKELTNTELFESYAPGIALGMDSDGTIISGIDFDHISEHCTDEAILQIINEAGSYSEVSVSGDGKHIIGLDDIGRYQSPGIEWWSGGRTLTMTGSHFAGRQLHSLKPAAILARRLFANDVASAIKYERVNLTECTNPAERVITTDGNNEAERVIIAESTNILERVQEAEGNTAPERVMLRESAMGAERKDNGHQSNGGFFIREGGGTDPSGRYYAGRNEFLSARVFHWLNSHYNPEQVLQKLRVENSVTCQPPLADQELDSILRSKVRLGYANHGPEIIWPTVQEPEPEPLMREMPPAEDYPVDALGEILGPAALRMHEVIGAPLAMCCQSVLAAAALAAQPHADVHIDGRIEPLSLFQITIGLSGERKSSVDNVALMKHREVEWARLACYRMDLMAWKRANKDESATELERPISPIMMVGEPTLEGLQKLFMDGSSSLGLFHDEGGQFLGGYSMNKEHRQRCASNLCKLHGEGEFDRVRATERDTVGKWRGRRFSMYLQVQPVIAQDVLSDALLSGQGFLPRVLFAWPDSTQGTRPYRAMDLANDPGMWRYFDALANLLHRPLPIVPDSGGELQPRCIAVGGAAKECFVEFYDEIERGLAPRGEWEAVRAWASKAPSQALRIGAVLTLLEAPDAADIHPHALVRATALMRFYLAEARRILGTCAVPESLRLAQALLSWCQRNGVELLHSQRAMHDGPPAIRHREQFNLAIRELEATGWAVPVPGGAMLDGAMRKRVWKMVGTSIRESRGIAL